jgi:Fe-Mn family superoxide dismutase
MQGGASAMKFELDPLPYEISALEPHMSARTLDFHYNKHHAGYMNKLEKAISGTNAADLPLTEIIRTTDDTGTFRNAAQVYNHTFFWHCMTPPDSREPLSGGSLKQRIDEDLGGLDAFRKEFAEIASGEFGSGWAWLVVNSDGRLEVLSTSDADTPVTTSAHPLLTLDVWEHAYYLDYQNERGQYIESFLDCLVNWRFAQENLDAWDESSEQQARTA